MARNYEEQRTKVITSADVIDGLVRRSIEDFLELRATISRDSERNGWKIFDDTQLAEIEGLRLEQLRVRASSKTLGLAICGENSSGKTAFLHLFLGIGKILPSGDGPITGRISKLTYAPGDRACIRVYKTFRDLTLEEAEVSLAPFFVDENPDWLGVTQALAKHVTRPAGMDENSADFERWARCSVEIHLPSPTLAQGIDVYDTPGFLIGDAPVLTEILHDLVELIHPTILFMYGNPSIGDATQACFVAMRAALRDLDRSSIFFLNSKADLNRMSKCKKTMTNDEFSTVLAEERARRYELLMRAPFLANATLEGLPASIAQCQCFDLCSVNSQSIKPHGPTMNEKTMQHIVQFVLNGNSPMVTRACQLLLPIVDFFLELSTENYTPTPRPSLDSETSAIEWANRFFEKCISYVDRFVIDVLEKVSQVFDQEKSAITKLFASSDQFSKVTDKQVATALLLHVIRPTVRQTMSSCMDHLLSELRSSPDLHETMIANEILVEALGQQDLTDFTTSLFVDRRNEKGSATSILYMVNTTSIAMMACASTFENEFWEDVSSSRARDMLTEENAREFRSQREMTVSRVLSKIQKKLAAEKSKLLEAVRLLGRRREWMLGLLIRKHYRDKSSRYVGRQDTLDHLQQYAGHFCQIECELIAAQSMAKFVGQTPLVVAQQDRQSTMCGDFTVDWGDEKNLTVKKLRQPLTGHSGGANYYQAHYHHRVARFRHPHIFNLRYLYLHSLDNQTSELWMIFPPIFSTMEQFFRENRSSVSLKQLLSWMVDIADALKVLHNNQLVHRNVILSNILLSQEGKALLANCGDWLDDGDLRKRRHPADTMDDGVHDDMKGFARVGKFLRQSVASSEISASVLLAVDDLLTSCDQPVTAESVQQKLASLLEAL